SRVRITVRRLLPALVWLGYLFHVLGSAALAAPTDYNLSAIKPSLPSGITNSQQARITTGNSQILVKNGSVLTPAELVALSQILHTGHQSLVLNAQGSAVGGTVNLTTDLTAPISSLSIPYGVTVLDNASAQSKFNLSGNLVNAGNIFAYSTNPAIRSASI